MAPSTTSSPAPELATAAAEGPVLTYVNKRIRALRKKLNRIHQMEESLSQGKSLHKEQEEALRSKPSIIAAVDELEKLRSPLAAAVHQEIRLAAAAEGVNDKIPAKDETPAETEHVEDLLNLIYFSSMFDLKQQNDFTSVFLTRTHERGCCLNYDCMTDDDVSDMLNEGDLDLIAKLGSLMMTRPGDVSLSHKNSLQQCIQHAKQWIAKSDQPIDTDSKVTYAELRAKLNKIMASGYFTVTPEIKAPADMAASAAANYTAFQIPDQESMLPVQGDASDVQFHQKDEEPATYQGNGTYDSQPTSVEETPKAEFQSENQVDDLAQTEMENRHEEYENTREFEENEPQFIDPRKKYNRSGNRGGSRGGGRRGGYPNGRGARGSSRGGAPYNPNGRNENYENGNFYPRSYHNNRGGGRRVGGGGNYNKTHNGGAQAGYAPVES